jgi:hypothetical protein
MKKTLLSTFFAFSVAAIASNAHAGISYAAFMYNALDSSGNPIVNGTFRMIIDVNPTATDEATLAASGVDLSSTWTWDPADILLDMGQIGAGDDGAGECYPFYSGAYPSGADATDKVYLLWFESPNSASPLAGSHYGYELLGTVGKDTDESSIFPVGGVASNVILAVPEPASLTALAVGALGLIRRRRNA